MKHCRECGSKKQDFECDDYDEATGKKMVRQACPKVGCENNCNFFGHEYKKSWMFGDDKCIKCGITREYRYY